MATPVSFSCASSVTEVRVNAMSDLVRRQVAPDDVEKYNLPWLYTHIPIGNGLHRDPGTGSVVYHANTDAVKIALRRVVHDYMSVAQNGTLEAFKRNTERTLAGVLRQHVLVPMYDGKIQETAFDLDKVQHIFRDKTYDAHPSAQGELFFTDTQLGEIVDDFIHGDRPVMIQKPADDTGTAGYYYFPEPDVGDVIGIVVNCADNSSLSGDTIHSTPQRFVMCMILTDQIHPVVGWQTALEATNVPTLAEVSVGQVNTDSDFTVLSNLSNLYSSAVDLYLEASSVTDTTPDDVPLLAAREQYITAVTQAITLLSTAYPLAPTAAAAVDYTSMVDDYVSVTDSVYAKIGHILGVASWVVQDAKGALLARVDMLTAIHAADMVIHQALSDYDDFPPTSDDSPPTSA